ncbi:uncharacterized protein LOC116296619 [Actinia tenebrosa]|uniref:Uncharacterized protein LOC116296619 n=1 Tax=Actinia tenebrosa TaxID=6105 RepID=A0A6P8HVX1_ACTTE|nr:uncharacterized protein LOC116296619 [Actinia tenebrosa]
MISPWLRVFLERDWLEKPVLTGFVWYDTNKFVAFKRIVQCFGGSRRGSSPFTRKLVALDFKSTRKGAANEPRKKELSKEKGPWISIGQQCFNFQSKSLMTK